MKKYIYSLFLVLIVAVLCGCGPKTPKDVAEKFMTAMLHQQYRTAEQYATPDSRKAIDMIAQFAQLAQKGDPDSIKNIQVFMGKEEINGNSAVVHFTTSESGVEQHINLVKIDDAWKVAWTKADIQPATKSQLVPGSEDNNGPVSEEDDSTDKDAAQPGDTATIKVQ